MPGTSLSENVVTYEELILSRELPESIVIAGAGAIGMEFGYVLKNYGVDVTIVEFLPRALPNEDAEVSKEIEKQFKKLGVKILTGTKVESIEDDGSTVDGHGQQGRQVRGTQGREGAAGHRLRTQRRGLRPGQGRRALTDRKAIGIDDYMRTNVPHIYAIGDVTGLLQLAHVAEAQGVVAAETIGGAETLALGDYRMMPRATFCQPQVASFGLTEEQARDEGYDVKVAKFPFTANAKAHGVGDPSGFVKLVADGKYGELLGGHLIGHDVSELLPELTLAQKWDLTANELARNVHTHPTMSEALQECFHGLDRPHDQLLRSDLGRRYRRIGRRPHAVAGRHLHRDRDTRRSAMGCWSCRRVVRRWASSPACWGWRAYQRKSEDLWAAFACGPADSRRCCCRWLVLGVTYL